MNTPTEVYSLFGNNSHPRDNVSHYTTTRVGGYYNSLLMGNDADFKKLLSKYSIDPGNNVGGYGGEDLGRIATGDGVHDARLAAMDQASNGIAKRKMPSDRKVAYVDLSLTPRQTETGTGNIASKIIGDKIVLSTSYDPNILPQAVPVYYLPWLDHGAVRLTIPSLGKRSLKGMDDPDIFFTAAISGCSVLFEGTPDNPTIYHCGGGTGLAENESAEFWEAVTETFITQEQAQPGKAGRDRGGIAAQGGNLIAGSVDKRDYVKQPGVFSSGKVGQVVIRQGTTKRAKSYFDTLKARHALGRLAVEDVAPWGCVLGRRDGNGNWTFYLQENATVTYHSVERKLSSGFKAVSSSSWSVARPLSYREVFPNGSRHVAIRKGLPRIL